MSYHIVKAPDLKGWKEAFYSISREWLEDYFTVTPADEMQLRNAPAILEHGGAVLFVMEGDQPVGTAALIVEKNGDVELAKMGVLRSHRGKGAGRFLMDACLQEAQTRCRGTLYLETLEVLQAALAMYESVGFVRVGEAHTHPLFGRTTFRMELRRTSTLGRF